MRNAPVSPSSVLAAVALAFGAACASAGPEAPVHVTIVHTNDVHGYIDRAAAVAAVARAEKTKNPNTLFLDAGDCISGTPVSDVFKGEPVFEVMTLMGYDAGTIGNHEFDHGWKSIAKFRELAGHPILNANAWDPEGRPLGDEPYRVFELAGVKVGVIGLLTEDMATLTTTACWAGCRVEAPLAVAKRLVPEVRAKCDVVVLLTHVGVEVDAAIAGAVPGIDLIVGGHSHTELKQPIVVKGADRDVPVAQAKCNATRVGILEFDWDAAARKVKGAKGRLVEVDPSSMPGAPDVKALADRWIARASEHSPLAEVIGRTAEKLTREKLRAAIERIYAEVLGADFGFHNMGGVRADIEAGDIRVEHIWKVLPFDNTLVTVRVKGDQVPRYARTRLGEGFDPEKSYVFATNSYVADQQKKYFGTTGLAVEESGTAMRDAVIGWVRAHGGFAPEATAAPRDLEPGESR